MKIIVITLLLLLTALSALAQTTAQIEKELVAATGELDKYSTYAGNYDEEKLTKANAALETKLIKYGKLPATLTYKFSKLAEMMNIASSDDGKFRIYTWDMQDGGTMHDYARVYQYKGADGKIYSMGEPDKADGGAGSFAYAIFTVTTKAGSVYIVAATSTGSNSDHFQSADLFKIDGRVLNDKVKLIKTKSGLTNTLGFEYNPFSIADTEADGSYELIKFDKSTNTLKIPVVVADEEYPNGKVTNKQISYRFDGTYFVKVG
jgi:hypothetical protein